MSSSANTPCNNHLRHCQYISGHCLLYMYNPCRWIWCMGQPQLSSTQWNCRQSGVWLWSSHSLCYSAGEYYIHTKRVKDITIHTFSCNFLPFPQDISPAPPPPGPGDAALTWVSYIGTVLSIICLTITIVTYLGEQWVLNLLNVHTLAGVCRLHMCEYTRHTCTYRCTAST